MLSFGGENHLPFQRPRRVCAVVSRLSHANRAIPLASDRQPCQTSAMTTPIQTLIVAPDEDGLRLDRWFKAHYPGLGFTHLQKLLRTGQVRVDGKRVESATRLAPGQAIRVPPLPTDVKGAAPSGKLRPVTNAASASKDAEYLASLVLYEDDDLMVIDKPAGLAVQGGSGLSRHVDQLLEALRDAKGNKPRIVHRLDRETSGCLVIAKKRSMAAELASSFRSRAAKKTYWALCAGVPKPRQGRVSTYLAREDGDERMKIARHGDDGASHALTYYAVVDQAGQGLSWLSLKPVTGRTHQLRAHTAHIGHPIVGDPKYFDKKDWDLPGGVQNRLHLLARRIILPHPRTKSLLDVTAPLPPHMRQSWNLLGFDDSAYDPTDDLDE